MPNLEIKKGNTAFPLEAVLTYRNKPIDLSGCKVKLVMKDGLKVKINSWVQIKDQLEDKGGIRYIWKDVDLNMIGEYEAEYYVDFPDGKKGIFPDDSDSFYISVVETLL